jgi:hypothetical protein
MPQLPHRGWGGSCRYLPRRDHAVKDTLIARGGSLALATFTASGGEVQVAGLSLDGAIDILDESPADSLERDATQLTLLSRLMGDHTAVRR